MTILHVELALKKNVTYPNTRKSASGFCCPLVCWLITMYMSNAGKGGQILDQPWDMKQKTNKGPDALHTVLWYLQLLVHTTWSFFFGSVLKRGKTIHRQRPRVCNRQSGNIGKQKPGGWQITRF